MSATEERFSIREPATPTRRSDADWKTSSAIYFSRIGVVVASQITEPLMRSGRLKQ
jgi:hypothetical protein